MIRHSRLTLGLSLFLFALFVAPPAEAAKKQRRPGVIRNTIAAYRDRLHRVVVAGPARLMQHRNTARPLFAAVVAADLWGLATGSTWEGQVAKHVFWDTLMASSVLAPYTSRGGWQDADPARNVATRTGRAMRGFTKAGVILDTAFMGAIVSFWNVVTAAANGVARWRKSPKRFKYGSIAEGLDFIASPAEKEAAGK
jgi:hypothetical protein